MEEELAKHLKQLADQFHGLVPVKCRELAFEYAEKINIPVPANWTEKQCADSSTLTPIHSLFLIRAEVPAAGPHAFVEQLTGDRCETENNPDNLTMFPLY
ncbi:unnamed protein product [Pleuronectes platessa]|uniref:Uncharacterized protein n=1 Tax=Pleuronectes platessa TaxID=8262 RepID=A0A9N7TVL0_PLEPL|nr:unnamed protein product [Pleuronectes platessa]